MAMVSRLLTVAVLVLLSVVPVEVIGQTVLPTNSQSLPAEIQALLRKDPKTLTDKERTELIPFIRPGIAPGSAAPDGTVNCFDYYHFGSVQVDVTPSVSTIASGSSVRFSGTIKNDNSYPIVDGQVYAKVFYKNQQEAVDTHQNGYALVDQFFVTEGVTFDAKQEKPIEFCRNY